MTPAFTSAVRRVQLLSLLVGVIAGLLAAMRLVDLHWLVIPAFRHQRFSIHWLDVVVPLAVGGFWLAAFASRLLARSQLPVCDDSSLEASHDAA